MQKDSITHSHKSNKLLLGGILFFLVINISFLIYLLFISHGSPFQFLNLLFGKEHVITLTEEGFTPSEITIDKGDTVIFRTTRDELFWPASNLHPTHAIYSEFDPKQPIEPEKTWNFTFNKTGEWKYHDHLAPYYTGVITVGDKKTSSGGISTNCNHDSQTARLQCWESLIDSTLERDGLDSAFTVLARLYDTEPDFARDCHGLVHTLGENAYEQFVNNEDFKVTPKTAYCNYGFYHGFMSLLLTKTTEFDKAREFCLYVDKQLAQYTRDAVFQCFHGIGHGAVGSDNTSLWGDEKKMIPPAIKLCEDLFKNQEEQFRCTSGVYNGIANFYITKEYNLHVNKEDPLWICHIQPERHKEACYGNMTPIIFSLTQNDFMKAKEYINSIENKEHEITTIRYLAGDNARYYVNSLNYSQVVNDCLSLENHLIDPCLIGHVTGLIEQGTPGKEYIKATQFCDHEKLTEEQTNACYQHVLSYLYHVYQEDQFTAVCQKIEKKYTIYCKLSSNTSI